MKQLLLLFLTVFIFSSCDIQYDGGTRLVVQGQLVDRTKNPIPNKRIEINTSTGGEAFSSNDLISFTTTDSEGKFTMVFPAPKNEGIIINTTINGLYPNDNDSALYQYKSIDALKKNFTNYKLNLDQIVLYRSDEITTLEILFNKTTANKQVTALNVQGIQSDDFIDLNSNNENHYFETHFSVIRNQDVKISYTITDYSNPGKATTTNHEAVVTINTEKVIHVITY